MTKTQVSAMMDSIGIPYAYHHFVKTDVAPPFVLFYYSNSQDFVADNINYKEINRLVIELCTDERDFELESIIKAMLKANELVYSQTETYLESERMYVITFSTSITMEE